jgi:hypothetical protein
MVTQKASEPHVPANSIAMRRSFVRRLTTRLLRLFFLGIYILIVGAILFAISLRQALAASQDAMVYLGADLEQLTRESDQTEATGLVINGQQMMIASTVTTLSSDEVLNRFQKDCTEHADGLDVQFAQITKTLNSPYQPATGAPGMGVFRRSVKGSGVVFCFAPGRPLDSMQSFERLVEFARDTRLDHLGDVRYVTARQIDAHHSHVVVTWTRGEFDLKKMIDSKGEAPGNDIENATRLHGFRRSLCATAIGTQYALRVYQGKSDRADAVRQFDADMATRGWTRNERVAKESEFTRVYSQSGSDLFYTFEQQGTITRVFSIEMGARHASQTGVASK